MQLLEYCIYQLRLQNHNKYFIEAEHCKHWFQYAKSNFEQQQQQQHTYTQTQTTFTRLSSLTGFQVERPVFVSINLSSHFI